MAFVYINGQQIWSGWNSTSTISTTVNVWNNWTTGTSNITSAATNNVVWGAWQTQPITARYTTYNYAPPQETDEQKKQRVREERKRKLLHARKQKQINRTAAAMLKELLTSEQWQDWQRFRAVRHVGRRGIFEINPGYGGELYLLDHAGKAKGKFCVHAPRDYPVADRVASLLLSLQTDEDEVMKKANRNEFFADEAQRLEQRKIRMQEPEYAMN